MLKSVTVVRPFQFLKPLMCAMALIALVLLAVSFYSARTSELLPYNARWTVAGVFVPDGVFRTTTLESKSDVDQFNRHPRWGSWAGDDAHTGELASPTFVAPRVLGLFVSGYPGKPANGIYLERPDSGSRLKLTFPSNLYLGELWKQCYWQIPDEWRGAKTRLVAVDHETSPGGWLGVSSPWAATFMDLLINQGRLTLSILGLYPLKLAIFFLPGLATALLVAAKRQLTPVQTLASVLVVSATLGYLAFWAFLWNRTLGRRLSLVLLIGALLILFLRRRDIRRCFRAIVEPLAYVLVLGLCYLSLFYAFAHFPQVDEGLAGKRFFEQIRPGDNIIPFIFADRIYNRQPLRPFCCGDWLSSDRPPLQAGLFLLSRRFDLVNNPGLNYQLLGTGLQCLWACAVWSLLTVMGTAQHRIRQVLGFMAFSGFLFYNSVYVWPKLLAATFILFLLALLYQAVTGCGVLTVFESILAALCLGLALMAHPGSVFSLGVFLFILIWRRRLIPVRAYPIAVCLIAFYVLPWMAYQKFYDPPGNRLLKMHLASSPAVDGRSTWQTIYQAYSGYNWKHLLLFKWENLQGIVGPQPVDDLGFGALRFRPLWHLESRRMEATRLLAKDRIWNAMGILNIGWLVVPFILLRKKAAALPRAGWIMLAVVVNFCIWSAIMFGPGQTTVELSSYADILLLMLGLLGYVLSLPRAVVLVLGVVQVTSLAIVWVFSAPFGHAGALFLPQLPTCTVGCLCALGLAWHSGKSFFAPSADALRPG